MNCLFLVGCLLSLHSLALSTLLGQASWNSLQASNLNSRALLSEKISNMVQQHIDSTLRQTDTSNDYNPTLSVLNSNPIYPSSTMTIPPPSITTDTPKTTVLENPPVTQSRVASSCLPSIQINTPKKIHNSLTKRLPEPTGVIPNSNIHLPLDHNIIKGADNLVDGNDNIVDGNRNKVTGSGNDSTGDNNLIRGGCNRVLANKAIVQGNLNTIVEMPLSFNGLC